MRYIQKNLLLFFSLFMLFSLSSCSGIIGYSVLLWNVTENDLSDGTVVPVYLKSNISKVYVIGLPETKEKIEVPLWKLSEPESKSKALKRAELYSEYKGKYAACVFDGLPIREDKVNTSKQVYRLRKNEIIRTLYKGDGVAPTNGGEPLPGEWLYVLTDNGSEGWCFSYNLRIFEMNSDGTYGFGAETAEVQEADETLEELLSEQWYPDYYRTMIAKKQIDTDYIVPGYGFDTGYVSGTIRITLPELDVSFPYSEYKKNGSGEYRIENVPIDIIVRNSNYIIVKYTDETGKPKTYNFITLDDDIKIEEIVLSERNRRQNLYKSIQSLGPDFKSSNYGTLSFNDGNIFRWTGFSRLVPGIIPSGAKGSGLIELKYFLDGTLKSSWDGVMTFHFENANKEIDFLYKKEVNGLRLAYANVTTVFDESVGRNIYTVSLPANSIVLFFQK